MKKIEWFSQLYSISIIISAKMKYQIIEQYLFTIKNNKGQYIDLIEQVNAFKYISLPNEILNHIFLYIESNTNKIIKNAISEFYIKSDFKASFWWFYKIKASFIGSKLNISWVDASNDEISIDRYFKYSARHYDRIKLIKEIKTKIKRTNIE